MEYDQRTTQRTTPTVTADWQATDAPGQYQALLALLFAGTGLERATEDAAA